MTFQRYFIVIFIFLLIIGGIEASPHFGRLTVKEVVRVHDGDTFIVNIEDIHPLIGKAISIRIKGIDAPEINDKREEIKALACVAREHVREILMKASVIQLENVQRDKYFRILADVYVDGINLGDELIKMNLALPYDGHKKPLWQ